MEHIKLFENYLNEYKYLNFNNGNDKDPNEPFFNKPKKKYLKNKREKERNARKKQYLKQKKEKENILKENEDLFIHIIDELKNGNYGKTVYITPTWNHDGIYKLITNETIKISCKQYSMYDQSNGNTYELKVVIGDEIFKSLFSDDNYVSEEETYFTNETMELYKLVVKIVKEEYLEDF